MPTGAWALFLQLQTRRAAGRLMQLRNHPLMTYKGARMWPPVWIGTGATRGQVARGEVGHLKEVRCYLQKPGSIFLIIEYGGWEYTGCLLFNDARCCEPVAYMFEKCCGLSIKEVSDLDLPA